jgi:uncharacterized membrane protein YcaP (DUF421 family)
MEWSKLSSTLPEIALVVVATVGIYLTLLILARVWGPRALARLSTFDVMVLLVVGPVAGRVILGTTTTLAAGIASLVTLFILRWLTSLLRAHGIGARLIRNRPVVLMAGPEFDLKAMARTGVSVDQMSAVLRTSGVRSTAEVACAILESAGGISVFRRGEPLDPSLFDGIDGIENVPGEMFAAPEAGR